MTLAIKINKCSDSLYWYNNLVGTIVPYVAESAVEFLCREPSGYTNIVKRSDADYIMICDGDKYYEKE